MILVVAAFISAIAGEWPDAIIVISIVLGSTILGFWQEYGASHAIEKLKERVTAQSWVIRDGTKIQIATHEVVPGDLVFLSAGSLVPADGIVLESNDLYVSQAHLTGEAFPVEKRACTVPEEASLVQRVNCVFMGTSVRSGMATMLVVSTAMNTVFGQIARKLRLRPQETEFERGIHRFGYLLTRVMIVMFALVMTVNILRANPALDSLMFALALAVGLTPELLPAILSITLSHGAQRMAKRGVIVRRLNAIENFGSMDVLCTDKTGTLTTGVVTLSNAVNIHGVSSERVLRWAYLNAIHQTGLLNQLDEAIRTAGRAANLDPVQEPKIAEIPYDFHRKRLSVIVASPQGSRTMITKGALANVLQVCNCIYLDGESQSLNDTHRQQIETQFHEWSNQGYRVLGIATRIVSNASNSYSRDEEKDLVFEGFLLFFDPPKPDIAKTISDLSMRGVQLKIITGDNPLVAMHVASQVNLPTIAVLTGSQLNAMGDETLWYSAQRTSIFAEVDPNQKERIILALQKSGHVVGYMGDGINDAPALHAADVGISVSSAVDVAKDASDLILLEQTLDSLLEGIEEGRRTFANTLKYILTTISANFGNMFSMAVASLWMPFLPLLASQILLNNFLSDIPATTLASDRVDPEWLSKPHRWDNRFISRYMVVFGLVSSLFDFLTFGVLLVWFQVSESEFRTGWFVESLATELAVALIVRTQRPFYRSMPSRLLLGSSLTIIAIALVLPYVPVNVLFGFVPLSLPVMIALITLTLMYVLVVEAVKSLFYRWWNWRTGIAQAHHSV
jgi:Mg2+-importing ATPase